MKNVLVATDFSHDAYSALFYATKLLSDRPCCFYILNVYDENTALRGKTTKLFGSNKRLEALHVESKEKLTEVIHKIVRDNDNPRHKFDMASKKGILTKVIRNMIHDHDLDLVVMGSKGDTGAKEIFLGSNTIQVVNGTNLCPILVVPKQVDFKAPKEIAYVTDFKKGCVKQTITPMLFLASLFAASIRIMHIAEEEILNSEQESNSRLLELCLKGTDHSFHYIKEYDDKALIIDAFLYIRNINMFVMVHHKRSFFERLVREPVIKDVSMYAGIPFLILPIED